MDLCGGSRIANCGSCVGNSSFPTTCGGGGVANLCGCTPLPDDAECRGVGANCGTLTHYDFACGTPHCVVSCGTCDGGAVCGGNGTANLCAIPGCVPETDEQFCARVGGLPQPLPDNCGVPRVAWCPGFPSGPATFYGYDAGITLDGGMAVYCLNAQIPNNPNCAAGFTVSPSFTLMTNTSFTFSLSVPGSFVGPYRATIPGYTSYIGPVDVVIPSRTQPDVTTSVLGGTGARDRDFFTISATSQRSLPMGTDCGWIIARCWGKARYTVPP